MDADGNNQTRLTFTAGFDAFPEWSPDGTKIAFTSDRAALDDIWVIDADGSNPTRLTAGPQGGRAARTGRRTARGSRSPAAGTSGR